MPLLLLLALPASLWASKKALDEIADDTGKLLIIAAVLLLAWKFRGSLFKV